MKAYWDILRELREDHDLTQAQVCLLYTSPVADVVGQPAFKFLLPVKPLEINKVFHLLFRHPVLQFRLCLLYTSRCV